MKYVIKITALFAFTFLLFTTSSCEKDEDIVPIVQLEEQEKATLIFMYEEEKMARDVYVYLHGLYSIPVFQNISGSEQMHMNFVLEILTAYEIAINVPDKSGVYANADIQKLYNDLTAKGSQSLIEALIVGATIEDVDIFDLMNAIEGTKKSDIIAMYNKLTCGSRNHMRAFSGQLDNKGTTYIPQYITQDLYDSILAGNHETCD
jgi:hypothetical protein